MLRWVPFAITLLSCAHHSEVIQVEWGTPAIADTTRPGSHEVPQYSLGIKLRIGEVRRYAVFADIEGQTHMAPGVVTPYHFQVQYDDVIEVRAIRDSNLIELDERIEVRRLDGALPRAMAFEPKRADIRIQSRVEPNGSVASRTVATSGVPHAFIDHLFIGSQFPYVVRGSVRLDKPWMTRAPNIPFHAGDLTGSIDQKATFTLLRVGICKLGPCAVLEESRSVTSSTSGRQTGVGQEQALFELDLQDGRPSAGHGRQEATYRYRGSGGDYEATGRVDYRYELVAHSSPCPRLLEDARAAVERGNPSDAINQSQRLVKECREAQGALFAAPLLTHAGRCQEVVALVAEAWPYAREAEWIPLLDAVSTCGTEENLTSALSFLPPAIREAYLERISLKKRTEEARISAEHAERAERDAAEERRQIEDRDALRREKEAAIRKEAERAVFACKQRCEKAGGDFEHCMRACDGTLASSAQGP
jgi:hypothetical protein